MKIELVSFNILHGSFYVFNLILFIRIVLYLLFVFWIKKEDEILVFEACYSYL